jgi:flagellar biosynthesis protein FlhB
MADASKTQFPTGRRIQKAREKGSVIQSEEAISAITLIALTAAMAFLGPWFIAQIKLEIIESLQCRYELLENSQVFITFINGKIIQAMVLMTPFLTILAICGTATSILISGWNFAPQTLIPKFEALIPGQEIKNLLSPDTLVKLLISTINLLFIGGLAFFYLRKKIVYLAGLQWTDISQVLPAICGVILGVIIRICLGLIILAAADYLYRRWRYFDNLMMSHEEVKQENRDSEVPPELKSKQRQKQFELGMRRMLKKVPKASVVLVNPTHVAVALEYKPGQLAPVVVAKGGDHLCEKIKEIARAYGVPIIRRPELAREIYTTVKLDCPIPDKLYTAVAEVLAVLYRLKHNFASR